MIAIRGVRGKSMGVIGLGRTGLATMQAISAAGGNPIGWDDSETARDQAEAQGLTVANLASPEIVSRLESLIVSPGVAHLYPEPHPAVSMAFSAGIAVDSDIGMLFRNLPRDIRSIAVTGSNGKSTTCALIGHVLDCCGLRSRLAGNIGIGALGIDQPEPGSALVVEISSYQAELASSLDPEIAVFLNFSTDHIERHGGLGGYFAAKRRLFFGPNLKVAIIGNQATEGQFLASQLASARPQVEIVRLGDGRKFGQGPWLVGHASGLNGQIGGKPVSVSLAKAEALSGTHNRENAGAALAACLSLGIGEQQIERAFTTFKGLPHRGRLVGACRGIRFVNDSKATNAESAAAALSAHTRIRWIAGGVAKKGGIRSLAGRLGNVQKVYLIGNSAMQFAEQIADIPTLQCGDLSTAVHAAWTDAEPGDTVLLAPAAASFDQFMDFEDRGRCFEREVAKCLS